MKKQLFVIMFSAISFVGFAQEKKDTTKIKPAITAPAPEPEFTVTLKFQEWQAIFNLVASADNLSAKQAAELNQKIANQINVEATKAKAKNDELIKEKENQIKKTDPKKKP